MSNNKQSNGLEYLIEKLKKYDVGVLLLNLHKEEIEQAKEKHEHEMCVFADEYASYVLEQSKKGIKGAMVSMCAWTFFKNRRR
jgi:pyridoxine 5'-phosphate synthase PdxJ